MRDIDDYESKYIVEPCEKYQVKFRRKKVIDLLKQNGHHNILEIGCGMEPLFSYFNDYDKMVIIEPGKNFFHNLISLTQDDKRIICINDFFENTVDTIMSYNIQFDNIIISSLLHEVEDPNLLLQCVCKVASEDTLIHVNVPNAKSIHRLLAKEMTIIKNEYELSPLQRKMQRKNVYDLESLKSIMEENGYIIEESGSYLLKFMSAEQMQKALEKHIIEEDIFEGLYKLGKYFPEYGSEIYVQARIGGKKS